MGERLDNGRLQHSSHVGNRLHPLSVCQARLISANSPPLWVCLSLVCGAVASRTLDSVQPRTPRWTPPSSLPLSYFRYRRWAVCTCLALPKVPDVSMYDTVLSAAGPPSPVSGLAARSVSWVPDMCMTRPWWWWALQPNQRTIPARLCNARGRLIRALLRALYIPTRPQRRKVIGPDKRDKQRCVAGLRWGDTSPPCGQSLLVSASAPPGSRVPRGTAQPWALGLRLSVIVRVYAAECSVWAVRPVSHHRLKPYRASPSSSSLPSTGA